MLTTSGWLLYSWPPKESVKTLMITSSNAFKLLLVVYMYIYGAGTQIAHAQTVPASEVRMASKTAPAPLSGAYKLYVDTADGTFHCLNPSGTSCMPAGTGGGGSGTVTSVGLTVPGVLFTVSGSPITGAGSFTFTLINQNANTVLAGPATGVPAAPGFRSIVAADIPTLNQSTTGNAATATALDHTPTLCAAGSYATGITASGTGTGCTVEHVGTVTTFTTTTWPSWLTPAITNASTTPNLNVSAGIVPETNGGTGANNTVGVAGHVLRSNGTHYVDSAIQVADVPALGCSQEPALTGDVTSPSGSCATTIATTIPNPHILSGNLTATAGQNILNAYNIDGSLWVDGNKYTTIAAAYADCPATGGVVNVPTGYSETLAASITAKASCGIMFHGNCAITMGTFQFIVPAGVNGVFIDNEIPWGGNANICNWSYTGTGNAFQIGSTSGDTFSFRLRNIAIELDSVTTSVGIYATRLIRYQLDRFVVSGVGGTATGAGVVLDGTTTYTGNGDIIQPIFAGLKFGIRFIGTGIDAGNVNNVYGGSMIAPAASSIGLDFQATSVGNIVWNFDCEVLSTCANFASLANNNIVYMWHSTNTTDVAFASGTLGNKVYVIGPQNAVPVVSDSSPANSGNSVIVPKNTKEDLNGNITYGGNVTVNGGTATVSTSTFPLVRFNASGGATDSKNYEFLGTSSQFIIRHNNDALNTAANALIVNNSGNSITSVNIPAGATLFQEDAPATFSSTANKTGQADIVADSSAINTTETIVVKTPALAASRLIPGTHVRFTLVGTCTTTAANVSTFTLRMGTNGTTADTAIATPVTSVAGTTGTSIPFKVVLDFTVRTASATGTGFVTLQLDSQGTTGITATQTPNFILPTMSTFNTTTASNILSLSYKSAATTTTSTFKQAVIEFIQN
jgi:hypothetical protein